MEWTDEEREFLAEMDPFEASLIEELPAGVHFRPYPGAVNSLIMLWEFVHMDVHPSDPPEDQPILRDHLYPELVLRALSGMVPGFNDYLEAMPPLMVDGGYYTKVPDNMPMIGKVPASDGKGSVMGAYMCTCLSGYGVMGANAAGELVAAQVMGEHSSNLPDYADTFDPARWSDEEYTERVSSGEVGGLQI